MLRLRTPQEYNEAIRNKDNNQLSGQQIYNRVDIIPPIMREIKPESNNHQIRFWILAHALEVCIFGLLLVIAIVALIIAYAVNTIGFDRVVFCLNRLLCLSVLIGIFFLFRWMRKQRKTRLNKIASNNSQITIK